MEHEILEFRSGGNSYGINVNDIREILPHKTTPTPIPNAHPSIEGIIIPRDFIIPILNLLNILKLKDKDTVKKEMLIVTSYNDLNIAIHVDSVKGIHRVTDEMIKKPDEKLTTSEKKAISGVIEKENTRIEIIDMKNIVHDINPEIIFV